jgi:hypothetical protein
MCPYARSTLMSANSGRSTDPVKQQQTRAERREAKLKETADLQSQLKREAAARREEKQRREAVQDPEAP